MFEVVIRYNGGERSMDTIESTQELIERLLAADGFCWDFEVHEDFVEATSEEATATIVYKTPEAKEAFSELLDLINQYGGELLKNSDDIETAEVYYVTGVVCDAWN